MYCHIHGGPNASLVRPLMSYVTCCLIETWTEPDGSTWEECSERASDEQCASASTTRNALASECAAPRLVTIQVQVVTVAMALPAAIKFDELMANPTVMRSLKTSVTESFATAAGVPVGYVSVKFVRKNSRRLDARKSSLRRLVAGGVNAEAEIVAPAGSTPSAVESQITSTGASALATSIVSAVLATPNIADAAPGYSLAQLQANRTLMEAESSAAFTAPSVEVVTMTLDSSSTLATAAQTNTATTTAAPTTPATTTAAGSTTAAPTNATTTLPSEGVLGGSRALAAMTVSTAAAVLIAVSA